MRVLAVSPYVPHDDVRHAGGVFLLRHLEQLREHAAVTVLVGGQEREVSEARRAPASLEVVVAPPRAAPAASATRQVDRVVRRLWPGDAGRDVVRGLLAAGLVTRAQRADVVELHWPEYAVLAPLLRRRGVRTPISVVEHDLGAQALADRVRRYGTSSERLRQALLSRERRRHERRQLRSADLVLVFKEADAALLASCGLRTATHVLEPYLDEPGATPVERRPRSVLFTGALWRQENDTGLRWFLDQVWPAVRRQVPDALFLVVGARPTAALLTAACAQPGVEVVGEVPDLDPWYRTATVFVAPLHVSGGLKFKVPQAMRYGLPVVATTTAAAGIVDEEPPGPLWAVTDAPDAMAASLTTALTHPDAAAEVGARAAQWCHRRYGFRSSTERVVRRYERLRDGQAP